MSNVMCEDKSGWPLSHAAAVPETAATRNRYPRPQSVKIVERIYEAQPATKYRSAQKAAPIMAADKTSRSVKSPSINRSFMVSSSLKVSVGRFPDSKSLDLTSHIRIDPTSMHRPKPSLVHRIVHVVSRQIELKLKTSEHHAQQIVRHVLTVRHTLADGAGLFKQGFGFGLFHSSTVGRLAVK